MTSRPASPADPAIIAAEHVVTPDGVLAPGWIQLDLDVTVSGGVARRLAGSTGAIAGSTASMELVVRRAITSVGLSVTDAARAASTTPARRLGLDGVTGSLRAGLAADIVQLDSDFRLRTVIARGRTSPSLAPAPIDI